MDVAEIIMYALSELLFNDAKKATIKFAHKLYRRQSSMSTKHVLALIQHKYNLVLLSILLLKVVAKSDVCGGTQLPTIIGFVRFCCLFDSFVKLVTQLLKADMLILLESVLPTLDLRNALRLAEFSSQAIRLVAPPVLAFRQCWLSCQSRLSLLVTILGVALFFKNVDNHFSRIRLVALQWLESGRLLLSRTSGLGSDATPEDIARSGPDCPVCLEALQLHQSVVLSCNHVYCRDCLDSVLERQCQCPMCRATMNGLLWTDGDTLDTITWLP